MKCRHWLFILFLMFLVILLSAPQVALAVYGGLDPDFGSGGIVTTAVSPTDDAQAVATQNDGKIVVAGSSDNGSDRDFALLRYNEDGDLDTGFGTGGVVTTDVGVADDEGYAVAIQDDGKIVVTGSSWSSSATGADVALVRYESDGSLDTTFASDGKVIVDLGSPYDQGSALAIQDDGKIVVGGISGLARFNSDGSLDPDFGVGGIAVTSPRLCQTVALQSDGKIVVAGLTGDSFIVGRYNEDGSLDTGFGDGGTTATVIAERATGIGMGIQPDGKIVVGGSSEVRNLPVAVVAARYNGDGTLDAGFGSAGIATMYPDSILWVSDLAIQADGGILLAGDAMNFTPDFGLVRFKGDGSPDDDFGTGGLISTDIGGFEEVHALAIQAEGRIVVAGSTVRPWNGETDLALARYDIPILDPYTDSSFGVNGVATTAIHGSDEYYAVAIQDDGKIVVTGSSWSSSATGAAADVALVRYESDGSLDTTFASDGKVIVDLGSPYDQGSALAIQDDGKIVVGGISGLARFNSDGSLDPDFGVGGIAVTSPRLCQTVALQSDGKIVVAGLTGDSFIVGRYNEDGSLDTGFGDGGTTATVIAERATGIGMGIQPDGKIVVGGSSEVRNLPVAVVAARYNGDGTLDAGFGSAGIATMYPDSILWVSDLAIQADGGILLAGDATNFTLDFGLVRFKGDGSPDDDFGTGGLVSTDIGGGFEEGHALAIQADCKIVLAGSVQDPSNGDHDFALVRYNPDGTLDVNFGSGGKATVGRSDRYERARAIAIQADNKIVLAGYAENGSVIDYAVTRIHPGDVAADADGDCACDGADNCPLAFNPDQADVDGDAVGDVCDVCPVDVENDADGDGLCESIDLCRDDYDPSNDDADGDGIGDVCDRCPVDIENDADGDGICESTDLCDAAYDPSNADGDGDGIGDACDVCPLDVANDADGDGFCESVDNCPAVSNPDQADTDGDGIGDACEFQNPHIIKLLDSSGGGLAGATVKYYDGGWQVIPGTTDGAGMLAYDIPDGRILFRLTHEGLTAQKIQDTAAEPTVLFQTVRVSVALRDHLNVLLDEPAVAQYYARGWNSFGDLDAGQTSKELLPRLLLVRMIHKDARQVIFGNTRTDPVFSFRTGKVNCPTCTSYYARGWREFSDGMQLLPRWYRFEFDDGSRSRRIRIRAGVENNIP